MSKGRNNAGSTGGQAGRSGCLAAVLLGLATLAGALAMRRQPAAGDDRGMAPDPESMRAGYEVKDMTPRQALKWLGLLIAAIALLFIVVTGFNALMVGYLGSFQAPAGAVANAPNVQPPPAPRLETGNGQVLEELHVKEDALLNNYAWIDQKSGVVRIPIDRAIELVAQRGLPTRPQAEGSSAGTVSRPASSSSGRTEERVP